MIRTLFLALALLAGACTLTGADPCSEDINCSDNRRCIEGFCRVDPAVVVPDAGPPPADGGLPEDAGRPPPDAGVDGGAIDAGGLVDAGDPADAGEPVDAGVQDAGIPADWLLPDWPQRIRFTASVDQDGDYAMTARFLVPPDTDAPSARLHRRADGAAVDFYFRVDEQSGTLFFFVGDATVGDEDYEIYLRSTDDLAPPPAYWQSTTTLSVSVGGVDYEGFGANESVIDTMGFDKLRIDGEPGSAAIHYLSALAIDGATAHGSQSFDGGIGPSTYVVTQSPTLVASKGGLQVVEAIASAGDFELRETFMITEPGLLAIDSEVVNRADGNNPGPRLLQYFDVNLRNTITNDNGAFNTTTDTLEISDIGNVFFVASHNHAPIAHEVGAKEDVFAAVASNSLNGNDALDGGDVAGGLAFDLEALTIEARSAIFTVFGKDISSFEPLRSEVVRRARGWSVGEAVLESL